MILATSTEKANPDISVVIPIYNAEDHLQATCSSVLSQTVPPSEIILVDDQSTDNSFEVAKALSREEPRIRVLRTPKNYGGPAGPRNLGVKMATGTLIGFCDADDLWLPRKLEEQIEVMQDSGAVMCSCAAQRFVREAEIDLSKEGGPIEWSAISFAQNRLKNRIVTSSVIVRADVMKHYAFNESAGYRAVEDYDCWLRVIEDHGFCARIDQPLVGYRVCDTQISRNKWSMAKKVFHVHWHYGRRFSKISAAFLAASHVSQGLLQRALKLSP